LHIDGTYDKRKKTTKNPIPPRPKKKNHKKIKKTKSTKKKKKKKIYIHRKIFMRILLLILHNFHIPNVDIS